MIMLQFFNPAGPRWSPDSCCTGGAAPCSPLDTLQQLRNAPHNATFSVIIIVVFSLIIWVSRKAKTQICYQNSIICPALETTAGELTALPMWLRTCFWATLLFLTGASNFSVSHGQKRLIEDRRWNLSCIVWSDVNNAKKGGERLYPFFMFMQWGGGLYLTPLRCHLPLNLLKCQVCPAGRGKIRI